MANMKTLIRIVFVIFIVNGIDCLGGVCDDCCDCCDCFKIKEYEEIKEDESITAESLVNNAWYNVKKNKPVLKIFKKKDDNIFPSKVNGDKISIEFYEKGNPKIADQNKAENPLKLEDKKYAFFEIETKLGNTVYLYCSDVESMWHSNFSRGIFEIMNHVSISVIACDTENVRNMSSMFYECKSLTKLDLKNFNTTNVTNMSFMFSECGSLKELDLLNFNTSNVTDMFCMFSNCKKLAKLEFGGNFDTAKVTNMEYMFYSCSNLTKLDLKNFNTKNVTKMGGMFNYCKNLTELEIGANFNIPNDIDSESMFKNCNKDIKNKILNKE